MAVAVADCPVAIASLAERSTLLRAARRPLMVGVNSNTTAFFDALQN